MGSLKIKTPKVSQRFETLYYYRQKFVNWEFLSSEGYMSVIPIPADLSCNFRNRSYVSSVSAFYPFEILLFKFVTEESYRNKTVYYDITLRAVELTRNNSIVVNFLKHDNPLFGIGTSSAVTLTSTQPEYIIQQLNPNIEGLSTRAVMNEVDILHIDMSWYVFGALFPRKYKQSFFDGCGSLNFLDSNINTYKDEYMPNVSLNFTKDHSLIYKSYIKYMAGRVSTVPTPVAPTVLWRKNIIDHVALPSLRYGGSRSSSIPPLSINTVTIKNNFLSFVTKQSV